MSRENSTEVKPVAERTGSILNENPGSIVGDIQHLTAIARAERVTVTYVARVIRGSLLAPDIVQRILDGRHPVSITVQALSVPIPVDWTVQRRHFGV